MKPNNAIPRITSTAPIDTVAVGCREASAPESGLQRPAAFVPGISRWALRVSNPRPSPCKGEANLQVSALSRCFACHSSALVYLGVLPSCYASVMQNVSYVGHDDVSTR